MSRTFAYVRVSTADQTTENQLLEIEGAGFRIEPRRVIRETISGSVAANARPGFLKLMDRMEEGDVLVVTKMDRLGRNAMDVNDTVSRLAGLGVRVHCLALGGMDLTSSTGKLTMGVINAVAQFERDLLIERTNAGIARAKAEGKPIGRPPALSDHRKKEVEKRLAAKEPVARIAREMQVSRQTIIRLRDGARAVAQDKR